MIAKKYSPVFKSLTESVKKNRNCFVPNSVKINKNSKQFTKTPPLIPWSASPLHFPTNPYAEITVLIKATLANTNLQSDKVVYG